MAKKIATLLLAVILIILLLTACTAVDENQVPIKLDGSEYWVVTTCDVWMRNSENEEIIYIEKGTLLLKGKKFNEERRWVIWPDEDGKGLQGHVLSDGLIDVDPMESSEKAVVFQDTPVYNVNMYEVDVIPTGTPVVILATVKGDDEFQVVHYNSGNNVGIINEDSTKP